MNGQTEQVHLLEDEQQQKRTSHSRPNKARSAHTEPKQQDNRQRQLHASKDGCQKPGVRLSEGNRVKNAKATATCVNLQKTSFAPPSLENFRRTHCQHLLPKSTILPKRVTHEPEMIRNT